MLCAKLAAPPNLLVLAGRVPCPPISSATSIDLFGCDRDRPLARIDQAGLLWLVNGDKLVALTENTATIERQTGARQTYRRKPSTPGRVLVWELMQ